jgi:very-short-patch-repair endonuclease
MTKQEFLNKAHLIHGDKYIYLSLSDKVVSTDDILIDFNGIIYKQKVVKHLIGRCPEKNTPTKTTEQFIKEATAVWGSKYDYSLTEYVNSSTKVKILYDNMIFEQDPLNHLRGVKVEYRLNKELFIKKAKEKWCDDYDYSLVHDFINGDEKVKIIHNETSKIYEQSPYNHLKGRPEKSSEALGRTTKDFIDECNIIHNFKYEYNKTIFNRRRDKVIITCPIHGDFEQVAGSHLLGMGCRFCGYDDKDYHTKQYEVKYTTAEFIQVAKEKWGNKYDYSLTEYVNSRTKIKIIYDGIVYEQFPMGHLKYPVEFNMNEEIFLIKAHRKWGDKYDYSLMDYKTTTDKIKIIYNGVIYEQAPNNHLNYAPELRNTQTLENFIECSKKIHGGKYTYDKSIYINRTTKMIITCPKHGDFEQKPGVHLKGSGCPVCNESRGESSIRKYLNINKIDFKTQKTFKGCQYVSLLKFDFYLPNHNICIEFDGIQHFEAFEFFGGEEALLKNMERDAIKNQYCTDNNIKLLRIEYDQIGDIENILKKNLLYKKENLN